MTSREAVLLTNEERARRTKARLRLCRMRMRREGKLLIAGYTPAWVAESTAKKSEVAQ